MSGVAMSGVAMSEGRARKPRFVDIARHAGVGIATVDRVMNARGGVSAKTTRRVLDSARFLGVNRLLPEQSQRTLRLEVILHRAPTPYYERLNRACHLAPKMVQEPVQVYITHIPVGKPARLRAHLNAITPYRDGIILYANDVPENAEIIKKFVRQLPVVTISTDIPDSGRHAYMGIDNRRAGETAARLSEAFCRKGGKALIIEPDHAVAAQRLRAGGFADFFDKSGRSDQLVHLRPDTVPEYRLQQIIALLEAEPDLRVLYSAVNDELQQLMAEAAGQRPVLNSLAKIVHDLSDENVTHLRAGQIDIVIDSNPLKQLVLAVDFLVSWHQGSTSLKDNFIDFDIFTAGNIPAGYPEIKSQ